MNACKLPLQVAQQLHDQDFSVSFEVMVEDDDAQPVVSAARVWAAVQGLMAVVLVMAVAAAVLHVAHGTAVCGAEEEVGEEEEEYHATSGSTLHTPLLHAQHYTECKC